MNNELKYYVYVYIDPRNYEEFYYGQGKGSRKEAHKYETKDTEKVKRITAIKKEGLEPIIKVIAANLSKREALLIEKTLIWKLGRTLTNISSGNYSEKFRPHNTFHLSLAHFDYQNGIYFVNVGERGGHRLWIDCKKYGFISAGQGRKYSDQIKTLNDGDVIVAYISKKGYVGIGIVIAKAIRSREFRIGDKLLSDVKDLKCKNILDNSNSIEKSEYLVKVDWKYMVEKEKAKWEKKEKLFFTRLVKASMDKQTKTLRFLEKEFKMKFNDLLD